MKRMDLLFELIRLALGNRKELSKVPSDKEWQTVFEEAENQAVTGICIVGIDRLMVHDSRFMVNMPLEMKLEWIGLAEQIRQQNKHVDKQTAKIWKQLKEDGLETAILKGQGIATMYEGRCKKEDVKLGDLRQPGDIDIWVKGGYQKVCDYVQRTHPTEDVAYHRFHYDYFEDTEVELHHRPTLMRNLLDDRKLARWYNSFGAESFVYLEEKGFAVPPPEFNRIFILTHIYRHFLFEGIGLRQVMDYYFVLRNGHTVITESADIISPAEKAEIVETLTHLRLTSFAEAMMWILHSQFGLEEQYLICGMNEKEGRFVLDEILQTGNFGQADSRYGFKRWYKLRHLIAHGSHLLMHYPSEVFWTPIWLVYHKVWKWNKVRKIRKWKI